jgi:hypothetical protein
VPTIRVICGQCQSTTVRREPEGPDREVIELCASCIAQLNLIDARQKRLMRAEYKIERGKEKKSA